MMDPRRERLAEAIAEYAKCRADVETQERAVAIVLGIAVSWRRMAYDPAVRPSDRTEVRDQWRAAEIALAEIDTAAASAWSAYDTALFHLSSAVNDVIRSEAEALALEIERRERRWFRRSTIALRAKLDGARFAPPGDCRTIGEAEARVIAGNSRTPIAQPGTAAHALAAEWRRRWLAHAEALRADHFAPMDLS